jgi:glycosyltransferase involved in cell wall biosynthesis
MDEFEGRGNVADLLQERERLGLDKAFPVIGTVARLVADKGHACLIKAFKVLSEKYPGAQLLIVGEGKHRSKLDELVRHYGLERRVVFVGAVKNVARLMQVMDIFVLVPSLKEGFGLAVIEAMTLNKPVIVSRIGGLTAIVEHERRGLIIEPENSAMLAEQLEYLTKHPEKRLQLAAAAYQYCRENFTIATMAGKIKALYEEVVSQS